MDTLRSVAGKTFFPQTLYCIVWSLSKNALLYFWCYFSRIKWKVHVASKNDRKQICRYNLCENFCVLTVYCTLPSKIFGTTSMSTIKNHCWLKCNYSVEKEPVFPRVSPPPPPPPNWRIELFLLKREKSVIGHSPVTSHNYPCFPQEFPLELNSLGLVDKENNYFFWKGRKVWLVTLLWLVTTIPLFLGDPPRASVLSWKGKKLFLLKREKNVSPHSPVTGHNYPPFLGDPPRVSLHSWWGK